MCFVSIIFNNFIEISFIYHAIHPFKVCNSVVCSVITEFCNHQHNQIQNICNTQKKLLSLALTPHILPQSQRPANLLSIDLSIVNVPFIITVFFFICLLIGGELLYSVVLVSAIQGKSATITHVSPPS